MPRYFTRIVRTITADSPSEAARQMLAQINEHTIVLVDGDEGAILAYRNGEEIDLASEAAFARALFPEVSEDTSRGTAD